MSSFIRRETVGSYFYTAKRCILTITRPNGARRSYAAPGVFTRKNEAKTQTTALAIEMGALEFVATGETDSSKVKNGLVLAPLTAHDGAAAAEAEAPPTPEDQAVDAIQNCCIEWRAGRVKPHWVDYTEPKLRNSVYCQFFLKGSIWLTSDTSTRDRSSY